jgi:hypothetical protein
MNQTDTTQAQPALVPENRTTSSRGRWVPLSLARRLVTDAMRACRGIPNVTGERCLDLAELVAARRALQPRPAWAVLFVKAFALVAADIPALRRSYISFPWPHLYEHPTSVGSVLVEREFQGEEMVFSVPLVSPHTRSLADLDADLRRCQTEPIESIANFRSALRLARLPWPLRRLGLWLGLHASGRLRERFFGTFTLSSNGSHGAGGVTMITAMTAALLYGLIDERGRLNMRLTFDHRVFDGGTAARALLALENVLRGPILKELISSKEGTDRRPGHQPG